MIQVDDTVGKRSLPPYRFQRSLSIHVKSPKHARTTCINVEEESKDHKRTAQVTELPNPQPAKRSISFPLYAPEHEDPYFRITYRDDALCQMSVDHLRSLLRTAKDMNKHNNNNILIARKALQYRRLLSRAQAVDVDDLNFDVNAFVRVTWCKADSNPRK